MYYILNETNQVIAADSELLTLCGLAHIDELTRSIALGETTFNLTSEKKLVITLDNDDTSYDVSTSALSSMLGRLTLVALNTEEQNSEEMVLHLEDEDTFVEAQKESTVLDLDSAPISFESEPDEDMLFENLFVAKEEAETIEETVSSLVLDEEETSPMALFIEEEDESDIKLFDVTESKEIELVPIDKTQTETFDEIYLDVDKLSQQIGVSKEDYTLFLNDYIDTALELENDLQNSDESIRSNAISTLTHLSDVLQLGEISDILAHINAAPQETQIQIVTSFYDALSKITTSKADTVLQANEDQQAPAEEPAMELFDSVEEIEEKPESKPINTNGFGTISLEGIKPIHFDFRLEEAANDLSLPVDLIEEFVHDFIEQAHVETQNMLKAYEKGDLDAIQKIGHLLKGASSNLRINALSDTLFRIQFCDDSSLLESYIKDYWGHFLSFEIQINALAK
ncbi:MAG TPA: hypothetical protein PLB06_02380 [Sulfurovum sp.]|jgi:hypothetical protein|nr:MAG: hypothetical protein B7Y63_07915 [Sulfurovum sp. 35-42-20]OYZ48833.1 MAG: hypothetical protein B7Y13_06550 [Sulfurovum sp. 24-42-9]OZA44659.1 MAG: hypothetical protein B7X80_07405 [Sulfurovum sp. 17-42-90]OZA59350.1 MAG: hypothetical protein B7X69_08470 [Sulfurovum sp. 39-42-12]HQR73569.1 hypothetical protein [Sulfurovum sp.]